MMINILLFPLRLILVFRFIFIIINTFFVVLSIVVSFPISRFCSINSFYLKVWAYLNIKILGFKIELRNYDQDLLGFYIAPHSSFWDIIVLSYFIKGFFVSKAQVKRWPLIGIGASLINTIFIDREKGISSLKVLENKAKDILEHKKYPIIFFPEGTRCAKHMCEFKPGVFHTSKQLNYTIIPIIIYYKPEELFYSFRKQNVFLEIFKQSLTFTRPKLYIEYLDPIYPNKFDSVNTYKDFVYKIMDDRYKQIRKLTKVLFN